MILRAERLSKSFHQAGAQIDVLRDLDLQVAEGETVAILGQSGSGKSTFLSLLAGLDRPDSGDVLVNDQRFSSFDERSLTAFRGRHMGIVFQQFHLMSTLSALENVRLPLEIARIDRTVAESRAREALSAVDLSHRMGHVPGQLSGGECQRVAIARAMVTAPNLLLADEPSGNLDTATGQQVMQLLFDLVQSRKMTMVLVTHNESLAERCHRRLYLRNGQLH